MMGAKRPDGKDVPHEEGWRIGPGDYWEVGLEMGRDGGVSTKVPTLISTLPLPESGLGRFELHKYFRYNQAPRDSISAE